MQRVINPRPRDGYNILKALTRALPSLAKPHPKQGDDLLEKIRDLLGHAKKEQD